MRQYQIIYMDPDNMKMVWEAYKPIVQKYLSTSEEQWYNLDLSVELERFHFAVQEIVAKDEFGKETLIYIGEINDETVAHVGKTLLKVHQFLQRYLYIHNMGNHRFILWGHSGEEPLSEVYKQVENYLLSLELGEEDKIRLHHVEGNRYILAYLIKGIELLPDSFYIIYKDQNHRTYSYSIDHYFQESKILQLIEKYLSAYHFRAVEELFVGKHVPHRFLKLFILYDKLDQLAFEPKYPRGNGRVVKNQDPYREENQLFDNLLEFVHKHQLYEYVEYVENMRGLIYCKQNAIIPFLYHQMMRYYEEHNYIDFIVRHYRLLEELLIFALGWDIGNNGKFLLRHQNAYTPWPIKLHKNQNTYRNLAKEYQEMCQRQMVYPKLLEYINHPDVAELIEMRHESIGGHGFEEITHADIERRFTRHDFAQTLKSVIEQFGVPIQYSYYEILNHIILLEVEEYVEQKIIDPQVSH